MDLQCVHTFKDLAFLVVSISNLKCVASHKLLFSFKKQRTKTNCCAMLPQLLFSKGKPKKNESIIEIMPIKRTTCSPKNLLNTFKLNPKNWQNYLKMGEGTYLKLLGILSPLFERQDTIPREAILFFRRHTTVSRFLATQRSYEDLNFSTRISSQFQKQNYSV